MFGSTLRRFARYWERLTPINTAEAIKRPYQRIVSGPSSIRIGPGEVNRNARVRGDIASSIEFSIKGQLKLVDQAKKPFDEASV
jgi:hypothetical protein